MTLVLDAGALIAYERGDPFVRRAVLEARRAQVLPKTHGGVVGQVWRSRSRQVALGTTLRGVDVLPLDRALGQAAGLLLAATGMSDVIDAALVSLAEDDDWILTSDPNDIARLAQAAGLFVEVIPV